MRNAAAAGLGAAVALGLYLRWVRPRAFNWGATGEEAAGRWPAMSCARGRS